MVYTRHFSAMDPLVGEAFVMAEAVNLGKYKKWNRVVFEYDSLILCREILSGILTQIWAIIGMMKFI